MHKVQLLFSCSFKSPPCPAPITAAILAVPFSHAFPLFAIGGHGAAFINRFLQRRGGNAMNDGDDVV
jgi:hypothetical protein